MGILDTINNIDKACTAIGLKKSESKPASNKYAQIQQQNAAHKATKAPIIKQSNPGKNIDTFNKQAPKTTKTTKKSRKTPQNKTNKIPTKDSQTVKAIKNSIKIACAKNGIDYEKLIEVSSRIAKMTPEQFSKMPESKQRLMLGYIGAAIQRAEEAKREHGQSKDIDITEAVLIDIQLTYDAITKGIKTDTKDQDEATDKVLEGNINNLSEEELISRLDAFDKKMQEIRSNLEREISKLPKSEQIEARKKIEEQIALIKEKALSKIFQVADTEHAKIATTIVDSKDYGKATKNLYRTRKNDAERMRLANSTKMQDTERVCEIYHRRGDDISKKSLQEYNTVVVSYMDAQNVERYQDEYVDLRKRYESGEYTPEYLNSEFFTATATGIGIGATINNFMTSDEKAAFLHNWDIDAQQFSDYDEVKQGVEEGIQAYIQEHSEDRPNLAKEIEEIKEKQNALPKGVKVYPTASKETSNDTNTAANTNSNKPIIPTDKKTGSNNKETQKTGSKENKTDKQQKNSSEKDIENALRTKSFGEVSKEYTEEEIAKVIIKQNIKEKLPNIINYIKRCNVETLKNLTKDCSTTAYLFILRNISSDKASKLYEEKNDMCFAARKLGEKILEEGKPEYEAA